MEMAIITGLRMQLAEASQSENWGRCVELVRSMLAVGILDEESRISLNRKLLIYSELV